MDRRKKSLPSCGYSPTWRCIEKKSFAKHILKWAGTNFSDFPWRRDRSPYEILIAEFLLKRTTATAVSRIYDSFLYRFPCLRDIASTPEEELVERLSGVGLQRQRARSLKLLATWLLETQNGEIPRDIDSLKEVPGLGSYSAAAISSFAYGTPIAIVDANVERIITRVFANSFPSAPSNAILNEVAQHLLPPSKHRQYNYGLLDLGRLVCRYAGPKCEPCPLNSICDHWAELSLVKTRGEITESSSIPKNKLRITRRNRGLSLQRLAELAGISKLTVIRIESGKTSPRRTTLEKLTVALEVDPDSLIG